MEALLLKVKITPRLPLQQVYLWIAVKQLTMDMWKSPSNPPHRQNLVLDHPLPILMYGHLNLLSLSLLLPSALPPSSNYMKPVRIMFKLELLVEFNLKSNFSVLFATSFTISFISSISWRKIHPHCHMHLKPTFHLSSSSCSK